MKTFNWPKAIGFGVLIWAIMYAVVWLSMAINIYDSVITKIILVLIAGVISYMFAANSKSMSTSQALGYGLMWVVVGVVLDLLITSQFYSTVFSMWEYWVGYALILIAPMFQVGMSEQERRVDSTTHAHSH